MYLNWRKNHSLIICFTNPIFLPHFLYWESFKIPFCWAYRGTQFWNWTLFSPQPIYFIRSTRITERRKFTSSQYLNAYYRYQINNILHGDFAPPQHFHHVYRRIDNILSLSLVLWSISLEEMNAFLSSTFSTRSNFYMCYFLNVYGIWCFNAMNV